jgi:hypothetical protein
MPRLWIVHRDPHWREALLTMSRPGDALAGGPVDAARFDAAPAPRAVLLGVAGDFETELEFAHRHAARLGATAWVLLAPPIDVPEVERLFDAISAEVVPLTRDASALRQRLHAALARKWTPALTERRRRDAIMRRFERWFGDLDQPELLAAVDPKRGELPLLVCGEPGTGRALLARYVHAVTLRDPRSPFLSVACGEATDLAVEIARRVPETGMLPTAGVLTICLEDVDRLGTATQRALRGWIEHAAPAGLLRAARVRWIATAGPDTPDDDALERGLYDTLAGLLVRIPPLWERPAAIEALVAATGRSFGPDAMLHLHGHPWPGNLRELEALLHRTVAAKLQDPIGADDLRFTTAALLASDDDDDGGSMRVDATPHPLRVEDVARDARPEPAPRGAEPTPPSALRRLSAAVAHEVGNPLVGIRTYASMLPGRYDDPEFRAQFSERVEADTRRIEGVVETLSLLAAMPDPAREPVDVSSLLAALLEIHRARIRDRRLVVLEELDRARPHALGDAAQLRQGFGALLDQVLAWVPARGDLFLATRHREAEGRAELRVELRFRAPGNGLGFADHALAVAALETIVNAHGGRLTATGSGAESSIAVDLPAPPAGSA